MDLISSPRHPAAEDVADELSVASRCEGGSGDIFACDQPNERTRAVCFPDDHFGTDDNPIDVTGRHYDRRTGYLRG
jgi:hypothetical protein